MVQGLYEGVPDTAMHLCIDMQRLFAEDTAWRTPWISRVMPVVVGLCEHRPDRTWFTRFIPARRPGEGPGTWGRYWERWAEMTLERMGEERVELIADLARFVPPARVFDKRTYSPWADGRLHGALQADGVDTLLITGAETDVCVLAAVLGAIDLGYRVVVVTDAICGSADESHDSLLRLYHDRFGQQVETAQAQEIIDAWR